MSATPKSTSEPVDTSNHATNGDQEMTEQPKSPVAEEKGGATNGDKPVEAAPTKETNGNHVEVKESEPLAPAPGKTNATSTVGAAFNLAVSWEDLKYSVYTGNKVQDGDKIDSKTGKPVMKDEKIEILKGLTGSALPGRTLAIMGSSGAGKTTFLNALSDRLKNDKWHPLSGSMKLNEVPYHTKYRKLLGFVTQDDVMNQMSTPEDLFRFSLRIRRGVSDEVADARVEEMLDELNLQGARDTLVGIPGVVSGLSGGERKRANIGVELIADPKVLFLDEPTSGLDAVTSAKVVSLCNDLATKGRTVIYTIHQPTAECVSYFQDLMLMCQGHCVYHGTMEGSVDYFSAMGYNCPDNFTPTDYYMTLLQDEAIGKKLVAEWMSYLDGGKASAHNTAGVATPQASATPQTAASPHVAGGGEVVDDSEGSETRQFLNKYIAKTGSGVGIQFKELFKRSFSNVGRNKMYVGMSIMQALFFGIVCGIIFWNLTDDVTGVQDRMGVIFMIAANRCFSGVMMMINTFPPEKEVFIREQASGAYSPAVYFLAKSFSELPVQIVGVLLESLIVYFATGLVVDAGRFFHYIAIIFALYQAATGLGMLISCAVDSFQLASGLAPLLMVPMMLAGGLMASTDRLRWGWVWLEKISLIRYGFILIADNEFRGIDTLSCDPSDFPEINGTAFCSRQPTSGPEVLSTFEFDGDHHSIWLMWLCLAVWVVVARLGCVAALNQVAKSKF